MQASRLTRIAGWLASVGQRSTLGKRLSVTPVRSAQAQNFEVGSCEVARGGLVGDEQLHHHLLRLMGALARRLHLHADGRLAHAGGGEHALALDLHHAGAAIAVRPVAGLRRVAEMRDVGAEPLRHLPDRLAGARLDLRAVELEGDGLAHKVHSLWTSASHPSSGVRRNALPRESVTTLVFAAPAAKSLSELLSAVQGRIVAALDQDGYGRNRRREANERCKNRSGCVTATIALSSMSSQFARDPALGNRRYISQLGYRRL